MKSLLKSKPIVRVLAVCLVLSLSVLGQAVQASSGGGGGGDGDGDGSTARSVESSAPPFGFSAVQTAVFAFHNNAIIYGPELATAKLLFDLTFAPFVDLMTALQYQQLYGAQKGRASPAKPPLRWTVDKDLKVSLPYQPHCPAGGKSKAAAGSWGAESGSAAADKACGDEFVTKTSNLFGSSFAEFVAKYGSDALKKREITPRLVRNQSLSPEDVASE